MIPIELVLVRSKSLWIITKTGLIFEAANGSLRSLFGAIDTD